MQTKAIILNTFKETVRNKVLYNIFLFTLFLLILSLLISNWSLGEQIKVMKDFGLTAISLFGLLIAIFVGIRLMHQEIERKTIYMLLSKPLDRWKIIVGKFFGLALTICINIFMMTVAFYLLLLLTGEFDLYLLLGIFLTTLEILIIVAISILFSTLVSPLMSAVYTSIFYLIGQISNILKVYFDTESADGASIFFQLIYYIVPNLERFNLSGRIIYNSQISPVEIFYLVGYAVFYIILTLGLSIVIFNKFQTDK